MVGDWRALGSSPLSRCPFGSSTPMGGILSWTKPSRFWLDRCESQRRGDVCPPKGFVHRGEHLPLSTRQLIARSRRYRRSRSEVRPVRLSLLRAKPGPSPRDEPYAVRPAEVGNGGELVPVPEVETGDTIKVHVTERADMLAHSASTQRMELAAEADALALALDAANSIKAQDSIERMLAAQAAAAHKLAM